MLGRNQTVAEATGQPLLGRGGVPVVDAVMVRARMIRLFGQNLLDHEFSA